MAACKPSPTVRAKADWSFRWQRRQQALPVSKGPVWKAERPWTVRRPLRGRPRTSVRAAGEGAGVNEVTVVDAVVPDVTEGTATGPAITSRTSSPSTG